MQSLKQGECGGVRIAVVVSERLAGVGEDETVGVEMLMPSEAALRV